MARSSQPSRKRPLKKGAPQKPPKQKKKSVAQPRPEPVEVLRGEVRLGGVEGATPGKWISTWKSRFPQAPLTYVPLPLAEQRTALVGGDVDVAIVREPVDRDGLHVIRLYEEQPVAVFAKDSHLAAADELSLSDFADQTIHVPEGDPGQIRHQLSPDLSISSYSMSAEDAIATVATGSGVCLVPMSIARLYTRKDAEYRLVTDLEVSVVGVSWLAANDSPLVENFIGVVRGRTARSSR